MDSKFYNLLGLCRRAGKISWGHDAALDSIIKNKANYCLMTSDASARLKNEFIKACSYNGRNLPLDEIDRTMEEMKKIIGVKAAVITVNDAGFAERLKQYNEHTAEVDINGN